MISTVGPEVDKWWLLCAVCFPGLVWVLFLGEGPHSVEGLEARRAEEVWVFTDTIPEHDGCTEQSVCA